MTLNFGDNNKIKKLKNFLDKEKVDVVVDTVCVRQTISFAIDILRKNGKIIMVGIPTKNFEIDLIKILCNEIQLLSSYLYSDLEFKKAVDYVIEEKVATKPLISKIFNLCDAGEAFKYKLNNSSIKVILKNDK
jgi:threonine dehydrogenase-like Zn-dependent dehydrogenase